MGAATGSSGQNIGWVRSQDIGRDGGSENHSDGNSDL